MTEPADQPGSSLGSGPGSDGAVVTKGLTRSFGKSQALKGFDMSLPAGKVSALVGPNGAGKTTLLLILAGLLAPDGGSARVGGADPVTAPFDVHREVGWMPDFFGVYDGLTSTEYLELFAAAYGMPAGERGARARELLDLVNLESFADAPVHTMSRGQKQRLGYARSIVHRPTVLLLDEPASGLDPRARVELRELVRRQADEGATVLVSSHILAELEEMSDIVVFAEKGRCKGIYDLRTSRRPKAAASGRSGPWTTPLGTALRANHGDATLLPSGAALVALENEEAAAELLSALIRDGVRVVEMTAQGGGLESAFMAMDEGAPVRALIVSELRQRIRGKKWWILLILWTVLLTGLMPLVRAGAINT